MALKIYGLPRSRALRNVWACEEGAVPYELVRTSWTEGQTRTPEYLRMNPNGTVPALDDDGFTMFESLAINLYIAKNKAKGLYPSDPKAEAKVLQWTLWGATELEPHNGVYASHTIFLPPEKRDPEAARAAWEKIGRPLGVLDQHLGRQPWLVGQDFTIADLNVSSIVLGIYMNKADFSQWKNAHAWLQRCYDRPAAKTVIAMRSAG